MKTSDIKRLGDLYRQVVESTSKDAEEVLEAKAKNEDNTNDKSDDGDGLDKVQPKAVKKKFKDRKDKDIDNDGDVDSSDEYLHKRRKAVSKAISKDESKKDFVAAARDAKKNGDKEFVFAGKKYPVTVGESLEEGLTEGKMKQFHQMMDDGKSADEIAKALKLDIKSVKALMKEQEDKPCPICGKVHPDDGRHDDVKEAKHAKKKVEEEEDEEEEEPRPIPVPPKKKKDDEEDEGDEGDADSEDDDDDKEDAPKKDKKKDDKKGGDNPHTSDKTPEISKIEGVKVKEAFDDFWTRFEGLMEKRKEAKGATDPEGLTDKESPKSKEFIAKHNVEKTDEEDEIKKKNSKEDGGVKPKSGKRPADSTVGEAKSLVDLAREVLSGENPNAFSEMKGDGIEDVSKKEKKPYDGRTKEAKAFLERMGKRKNYGN